MRRHVSGLYVLGAILAALISFRVAPAFAVEPYEVEVGLWTCPRGYQIQTDGTCKSNAELPHGPVVEISSLPSAGDGAPTACPSGGCDSLLAPLFYSIYSSIYSAPMLGYGAWDWRYYASSSSWLYHDGWTWPYYSGWAGHRRFDGQLGFWKRARWGASWGGFQGGRRHFHSFSARGSRPWSTRRGVFGGTASGHSADRGRTWRR